MELLYVKFFEIAIIGLSGLPVALIISAETVKQAGWCNQWQQQLLAIYCLP